MCKAQLNEDEERSAVISVRHELHGNSSCACGPRESWGSVTFLFFFSSIHTHTFIYGYDFFFSLVNDIHRRLLSASNSPVLLYLIIWRSRVKKRRGPLDIQPRGIFTFCTTCPRGTSERRRCYYNSASLSSSFVLFILVLVSSSLHSAHLSYRATRFAELCSFVMRSNSPSESEKNKERNEGAIVPRESAFTTCSCGDALPSDPPSQAHKSLRDRATTTIKIHSKTIPSYAFGKNASSINRMQCSSLFFHLSQRSKLFSFTSLPKEN